MIEAIGTIIVYEVILIGIVDQSKENKSSEYILIMKAYKLGQIIRSIHQGSDISIHTFKDNLSSKSRLNSLKKKQIKITWKDITKSSIKNIIKNGNQLAKTFLAIQLQAGSLT